MNRLKFVFAILLSSACSQAMAENIKPKLFPGYFTGLVDKVVTDYASAKLDYELTARDGKDVHFASCKQVEATRDSDIATSEYHLLTMLRLNCVALKQFAQASHSKASYLQEILIHKDIRNLPATAYPYVNKEDRKSRENQKLKDHQKKLTVSQDKDGSIKVQTETDDLHYQVLATGDFNHDILEDALIRIDWHVIGAFGKGFKLIMVTKKAADQAYEITELN